MSSSFKLMSAVAVALSVIGGPANGGSITVVAPNDQETVEGNGSNVFPFGASTIPTQRYQQVYAASQFSAFGGPAFITQIAFRPDGPFGRAFQVTIADVQIRLSTTAAGPDGLSTTFADNTGADDTLVYSGSLSISSTASGPPSGPRPFDIIIPLQHSFLYDPAAGNLLLDVRRFSTVPFNFGFDQQFAAGDSISRVTTLAATPGGVNSADGFADSRGLVTQFTAAAVPEPASIALLGVSIAGAAGYRWRRQNRMPL